MAGGMKIEKAQMSSRERVHATARGLPVDRVPVFIWIEAHAGARMMAEFRPSRNWSWNLLARFFWKRFRAGGTFNSREIWRIAPLYFDVHTFNCANAYALELGSDIVLASHSTPWQYTKYLYRDGHILFKDLYGVTRGMGSGIYPDMVRPAINEIKDLETYRFPDFRDERRYNIFRKYRKAFPDKSIAAEVWGTQDFTATSLFGMEKFMMFLVDYPEEMKKFMERWADHHIEAVRRSVAAGADLVMIEDDYGYDQRPLISPRMWKEFTYQHLKRLSDAVHETGALTILHSCGFQMPFLEHYVQAGIDMLHAFQPMAGNDFKAAHEKFGDQLTFITGIDIQRGEMMSAGQLKQDMVNSYRIGGRKGHHVLGTTHEIQYTMPGPNLRAIFETLDEIQQGRYD